MAFWDDVCVFGNTGGVALGDVEKNRYADNIVLSGGKRNFRREEYDYKAKKTSNLTFFVFLFQRRASFYIFSFFYKLFELLPVMSF